MTSPYYAFGGAFTGGNANPGYVYTLDGPRRMFYNADGTPIAPGNVLFGTNGGAVLPKPDITAADGVPTGIASFNPFYGTSAGGPHAGAIAALQTQTAPTKMILPFDNTTGQYITGIALGNIGVGAPATITATAWDVNGASIVTGAPVNYHSSDNTGHESATWPANGHDAFFPSSTIPLTDGKRGIIQFQIGGSGALTGVGLRVRGVYPNQTFTSMPTALQ